MLFRYYVSVVGWGGLRNSAYVILEYLGNDLRGDTLKYTVGDGNHPTLFGM